MKIRHGIVFCSLFLSLVCCTQQAGFQHAVTIVYEEVFTEISIQDGKLSYYSKSAAPGAGNLAGPENYIGQSVDVLLSSEQLQEVEQWTEKYRVFNLIPPSSAGNPDLYEAAFYHRLKVTRGKLQHNVQWTDASIWNDMESKQKIDQAVRDLKTLCTKFMSQYKTDKK